MDAKLEKIRRYLQYERKRLNYTLQDLWERTGITSSHISRIERGENALTIYTFVKLVHALNLSPSDFLRKFFEFDFKIPKLLYDRHTSYDYPTFTIPDIEHYIHYSIKQYDTDNKLITERLREHVIKYRKETLPETRDVFNEEEIRNTINSIYNLMTSRGGNPPGIFTDIHYPEYISNDKLRKIYRAEGALMLQDPGSYLFNLRKSRDLTLQELGDAIGVVPSTITSIEREIHERLLLRHIIALDQFFDTKGELLAMSWRAVRLYTGIDRLLTDNKDYHPIYVGYFEKLLILLRVYQHLEQLDKARDYVDEVRKDARRR